MHNLLIITITKEEQRTTPYGIARVYPIKGILTRRNPLHLIEFYPLY
jgi:hypothetical protein